VERGPLVVVDPCPSCSVADSPLPSESRGPARPRSDRRARLLKHEDAPVRGAPCIASGNQCGDPLLEFFAGCGEIDQGALAAPARVRSGEAGRVASLARDRSGSDETPRRRGSRGDTARQSARSPGCGCRRKGRQPGAVQDVLPTSRVTRLAAPGFAFRFWSGNAASLLIPTRSRVAVRGDTGAPSFRSRGVSLRRSDGFSRTGDWNDVCPRSGLPEGASFRRSRPEPKLQARVEVVRWGGSKCRPLRRNDTGARLCVPGHKSECCPSFYPDPRRRMKTVRERGFESGAAHRIAPPLLNRITGTGSD
jgi:hypothetical protein